MRLFGDLVTPEVSAAAERGIWAERLWHAVEEAGYPDVLADGPSGMVEAATILRAAGHHAAPIPLAETMLARWLCAGCAVEAPAGALTIGPVEPEDRLDIAEAAVSGNAGYIPWGHAAAAVVLIASNRLLVVERPAASVTPGTNLAGEPRDYLGTVEPGAARRRCPRPSTSVWCSAMGHCFAPHRWRAPWKPRSYCRPAMPTTASSLGGR